ncbi:hypothetical protein GE107_25715 [Cohnella sp. CFH 77786]|uniref:hypothetical protein n=1 Tax=Cohnella sp. CFH 77786 TaxID=2662265 RepID=UPI001C60D36B|nr:hypothetical protein [Cohnella sp. CFH 77786]MBW5449429.1 hypothetical protein [Cohnella sp. CFH 77786]
MFELRLDPDEKQLHPYKGHQVCLLMKDGTRKIGQLTACISGKVILNGGADDPIEATISRKAAATRRGAGRRRARKPLDPPAPHQPQQEQEWDDFSFAPIGLERPLASLPRESVPLKKVDSILVL